MQRTDAIEYLDDWKTDLIRHPTALGHAIFDLGDSSVALLG